MLNKKKVINDLELTTTLKTITYVYQEVSAMRMRKIRGSVLDTRNFLDQVSNIFHDLQANYKKIIEKISLKEKKTKEKKQEKVVTILICTNSKLSGDISVRVFNEFKKFINQKDTDLIVVGKVGSELFREAQINKKYLYFDIPDTTITMEDLKPILFHLTPYEKVYVFFGQYQSLTDQKPALTNITAQELMNAVNPQKIEERRYLFEPDIGNILNFFKVQVKSILLKQTVHESQLAWFASRIMAMERASEKVDEELKKLTLMARKTKLIDHEKKQIERFAGISLWKT